MEKFREKSEVIAYGWWVLLFCELRQLHDVMVWCEKYHFHRCPQSDDIFEEWETSQENIDDLAMKIVEFEKELADAKQEQDGYTAVRFPQTPNSLLYYKRLKKDLYHFIVVDDEENARMYTRKISARAFLREFEHTFLTYINEENKALLATDAFPLYRVAKERGDEYLLASLQYAYGGLTKRAVAILNATEKTQILFADKEIYGVDDIGGITYLSREGNSMFHTSARYRLKVWIDGDCYNAEWGVYGKELRINCQEGKIRITDELHERIKALTGETETQRRARRLLQLDNYVYGDKNGLDKLSLEKRNKIFEELGQVSIEEIKSLPPHYLQRLTVAQLFDWLHCSGNAGYPDIAEYIENLAKARKEKYGY